MRSLTLASLLALPLALAQQSILTSSKRGLIYVKTENSADNHYWTSANTDLTWYYNYGATPTSQLSSTNLSFVPMLWGAGSDSTTFASTIKSQLSSGATITHILAFNEPNGCSSSIYGSSCISAETASQIWKSQLEPLRSLGLKIGAPAVTSAPSGFTWLQNFFTACAGSCHPDFLPIHYYGSFQGLASHIGQVNATYPNISSIWVTEYGFPNQDLETSQDFYNQSSALLDRWDAVERYAYFGSFRSDVSNVGPNAAMLTQKGQLTDIGAWYLGEPEEATGNVPKGMAGRVVKSAGWSLVVVAVSFWCVA